MAFWIAVGFISSVVAGLVFIAARKPSEAQSPAAAYDLQVYRDQLSELDRDLARGTLSEAEATRARTEVSRRILDADRAIQASQRVEVQSRRGLGLIGAGLVAMIGGAFWLYSVIGAPGYPDLPLNERIALIEEARENRPSQDMAEDQVAERPAPAVDPDRLALVAQLRIALESRPDDSEGLNLLAANEAMLGNFRAAHRAQSRLIGLLGEDVIGRQYIDLAEMMIFAAGGYISPEAEVALRMGLQMEPEDGTGRYYAGQMYTQQGRPDLALPIWSGLLSDSSPDAPWVEAIQLQIADVAFAAGVDLDPALLATPRGPTAADVAAAEGMDPADQQAMIQNMVAGLADRLATEGGTPEDWARLITAYGVLDQINSAQLVLDNAQVVFADRPDALQLINDAFGTAMARAGSQ